ncbi:hypothetical protein ABEB36_005437 [Hypothenemus hampei]|uniref:Protein-associating with the carboxyl-terminal domain of ezrin n=1 Tax=Hypothenemus hampei TaxID=57062 RepID=A0ABD1EZB2_HYPHA
MGNDHSQIPGLEIDERVVEVSDFWSQQSATVQDGEHVTKLSLFSSDLFFNDPFWVPQTPLKKFSKNLMIYRHPSIVRYVSSWQKACKFYLAVEEVIPLSHIIAHMSTMEICLGLYSILKALCFLHETAHSSHNNLCLASIFVTKDSSWKLGGMEYLCPYKTLTAEYLQKSKNYRYNKAVDTNEDKNLLHSNERMDFVDVFAFCTLVGELIKSKHDNEVPYLASFKAFCTQAVQEPRIVQRPRLRNLLEHDFFNHTFIKIYSFLIELPLKSDNEKTEFFAGLKEELQILDEKLVVSQLGRLLVSRMVLLNKIARNCLLPYVMIPKKDGNDALFSEELFKLHIAPKLLNVFRVRDAEIRILLLKYFPHFMHCFSQNELQCHILPELLVAIKDTNNDLVSATLHTLAELVPILGADIVIGGKRAKLFNDGKPKNHHSFSSKKSITIHQNVQKAEDLPLQLENVLIHTSELENSNSDLPERPRPDGEEGETSTDEVEQSGEEDAIDDNDNWEDWDNEQMSQADINNQDIQDSQTSEKSKSPINEKDGLSSSNYRSKKILDITELDIKNQTKRHMEQNEIDFFEDMEPVIKKENKFLINQKDYAFSSKLSAKNEDEHGDGWGDEWD